MNEDLSSEFWCDLVKDKKDGKKMKSRIKETKHVHSSAILKSAKQMFYQLKKKNISNKDVWMKVQRLEHSLFHSYDIVWFQLEIFNHAVGR